MKIITDFLPAYCWKKRKPSDGGDYFLIKFLKAGENFKERNPLQLVSQLLSDINEQISGKCRVMTV